MSATPSRHIRALHRICIALVAPLIAVLSLWAVPAGAAGQSHAQPSHAQAKQARPTIRPARPRGRHVPRAAHHTPAALSLHPAVANVLTHISHHFTVNSLGDTHENPPNGTTCHDTGGHCTLRAAIETANNASGVDQITIAKAGTIHLSASINTSLAPTTRMIIQGLGAAKTHVSGANCACYIFEIDSGAGADPAVEIDDMTITQGQYSGVYVESAAVILDHDAITNNDPSSTSNGGGIYLADTDSQLWLTHSTVSGNKAPYGGGIYLNYGAVVLSGDTIGGPKAANGNAASSGEGGGIFNDDGVLSIYSTHVDHNRATVASGSGYGAGIYNCCYTLSMQGGSISGNVLNVGTGSGYGGGLYAESSYPEQLNGVAVNGNSINGYYGQGGGIYDDTYMQLNATQVNNNKITVNSNSDYGYGAGLSDEEQLQMVGGSISGNQIVRGTGITNIYAYGAGFYEDEYGSFDGVKISGNKALAGGSGYAYGGGGYSDDNSRFSGLVVSGNVSSGYYAYGAGLYLDPDYATHIGRSTFSGNTNNAVDYAEGAALADEGDDLVLTNVAITGSKSNVSAGGLYGGDVYCEYVCNMDTVSISKTASTSTDSSSPYVYGGAVYADEQAKWDKVKVSGTTNWSHGSGGYVYGGVAYLDGDSELNSVSASATKNTVGPGGYVYGGDVLTYEPLQLNSSTFNGTTNNVAGPGGYVYGGVAYVDDYSNMTRVKALNTSDNLPGAGSYVYGGVLQFYDYVTAVNLSVVGAKVAVGTDGYVYGGGVYDDYASSFDRITVAKVAVSAKGASSYLYGGGMYLDDGMNVVNSTISNNAVKSPGNTSTYGGFGGGVYANDMITFTNDTIVGNSASRSGGGVYDDDYINTFRNTIVSGNVGKNCGFYPASTLLSAGHNLEAGTSCKFTSWGDLNKPAHLGLLKMNGGFAPTMMPLTGSAAINHGGIGGCPAVDERGVLRPQGPSCDIGAVEVKPIKKKK